jgi:hydrogenase nickel incorporation protein HypA/HybF
LHELSLSGAIVNTVVKHAAGRRVTAVDVRVGRLRQVVPDTLEFYFGFVADGTVCEGAELRQEVVPALVRCPQCRREWELDLPIFRCAACGEPAEVVSGNEFEVESIEVESVEAEEVECIAQR